MYRRWFWPLFAVPGVVWLVLLFLVPFYAVIAVAFGTVDPIFQQPVPFWNPADWNTGYIQYVFEQMAPGGVFWTVSTRTLVYVAIAVAGSLLIGYPVAYYISRHARRTKTILLVLLIIPFWVSYLMRMLAWIDLLLPDGWVNRSLMAVGVLGSPYNWLNGQASTVVIALAYGYVPYLILPLLGSLDRIDARLLEASRDLGASTFRTFVHVTLPLSRQGILAGLVLIALPMFGDFYTNDLISGSPKTNMLGNQINLYFQGGPQKTVGASLVIVLFIFLTILMAYYLWSVARASKETAPA